MNNANPYYLKIEILDLPPPINQYMRKHWAIQAKIAREWHMRVSTSVGLSLPEKPLQMALVMLRRYSSVQPDPDGLCSSFKHVIDGLVNCGVLLNDRYENIGMPTYSWVKAPRKMGKILVEVLEFVTL